jgi:outer membrane receptor protein involved in Fe transport
MGGVIIDGQAGSLVNTTRGNSDLNPERQKEFETGVDVGLLNDRIVFEATYYNKTSDDLIFLALVPASSGYANKFVNGGTLKNRGWEFSLNADVLKKGDFDWYSGISWWKNTSEVTELNVPAFVTSAFGATLGTFYIDTNRSATQLVGIGASSDIQPGDRYVKYGDFEPTFQMSFYEEFHYKGFSLTFLLHWKDGGYNVNLTSLLTDLGGTSHDYDEIALDPTGQLGNGPYRVSQLGVQAGPWVEKAGYVRLREIGLYYTFNGSDVASKTNNVVKGVQIGISAHNALNWFKYDSYDPEVSNFVGNGLASGVEVNPFPSAKQFLASLSVNF